MPDNYFRGTHVRKVKFVGRRINHQLTESDGSVTCTKGLYSLKYSSDKSSMRKYLSVEKNYLEH